MNRLTRLVAFLFFGSGVCALIYEIAWFREFRLVFGASTLANAAVLAVFIGGLGAGGLVLGKRADAVTRPLVLYAVLEAGAAVLAALSPFCSGSRAKRTSRAGGTIGSRLVRRDRSAARSHGDRPARSNVPHGGDAACRCARGRKRTTMRRDGASGCSMAPTRSARWWACVFANFFLLELLGTKRHALDDQRVNLLIAGIAFAVAPRRSTRGGRGRRDRRSERARPRSPRPPMRPRRPRRRPRRSPRRPTATDRPRAPRRAATANRSERADGRRRAPREATRCRRRNDASDRDVSKSRLATLRDAPRPRRRASEGRDERAGPRRETRRRHRSKPRRGPASGPSHLVTRRNVGAGDVSRPGTCRWRRASSGSSSF